MGKGSCQGTEGSWTKDDVWPEALVKVRSGVGPRMGCGRRISSRCGGGVGPRMRCGRRISSSFAGVIGWGPEDAPIVSCFTILGHTKGGGRRTQDAADPHLFPRRPLHGGPHRSDGLRRGFPCHSLLGPLTAFSGSWDLLPPSSVPKTPEAKKKIVCPSCGFLMAFFFVKLQR